MPTNNENATRKALVQAFGGTGGGNNEKDFDKALIAAVSGSNVKTKPAVVALTPLTGAFGTTGSAIVDGTATYSQTITNDNNRRLEDKINAIIAALKA